MGAIPPVSPVGELIVPDERLADLGFRDWIQLADAVSEEARRSGRIVDVTYVERSRFAVIRWRTPIAIPVASAKSRRPSLLPSGPIEQRKLMAKIRAAAKARDKALRAGAKVLADARADDGATDTIPG